MKNLIKSFLFTMVFLLIICKPGVASTFATPNVELEGNADGIVFIQGDEPFLWSDNILPGDKLERNILLNNKHKDSYKIFMRAERINKKESYDLLEKIELKVIYDGNCIYDGFVSGQNGLENNIYLGEVKPGESKKLEAFAEFPGKEAGNEYKNKKAQVDWIFTAVKDSYSGEESLLGSNKLNKGNIDSNQNNIKNTIDNIIVPKTGDSGLGIYFVIFIIASIAILTLNFDFIKNKLKIFKKEE
ncbi:LPXTG cell wall anchor domain-containing protein [Clostridium perfringens]